MIVFEDIDPIAQRILDKVSPKFQGEVTFLKDGSHLYCGEKLDMSMSLLYKFIQSNAYDIIARLFVNDKITISSEDGLLRLYVEGLNQGEGLFLEKNKEITRTFAARSHKEVFGRFPIVMRNRLREYKKYVVSNLPVNSFIAINEERQWTNHSKLIAQSFVEDSEKLFSDWTQIEMKDRFDLFIVHTKFGVLFEGKTEFYAFLPHDLN